MIYIADKGDMTMSFIEELKNASQKVIEDTALTVSINIQPKLKKLAEKGYKEGYMDLDKDQAAIMLSEEFIKLMRELLDGIQIEIVEKPVSVLFPELKRKLLRFSWCSTC